MPMTIRPIALCLILITAFCAAEEKKPVDWKSLASVEAVCTAYPQEVDALLQALNLELPGLAAVKTAAARGDRLAASEALLAYYRAGTSGAWLRAPKRAANDTAVARAEAALANRLTFYGQTDAVPTTASGGIDWHHKGPAGDWEWTLALNRHFLLQWLLDGYLITGREEFAVKLDALLRDWYVASYPYPAKKNVGDIWRGLEVSFRPKAWSAVFYGLIDDQRLSPGTRLLMLTSLPHHAHHLRHFHSGNNWLTMELSGLATIAAAWPEFADSRAWMDYATRSLTAELGKQVYPDGVQTELTSSYHVVALRNFQQFADLCQAAGEPLSEAYTAGLAKMIGYIAESMRPDGANPLNNDADRNDYRSLVTAGAASHHRPDWLYIATNGAEGEPPAGPPSRLFPWAGQLVSRSGWDAAAQWSFFDLGPWGTGHQHNDKLHLSVAAHGRDLLVDSGRFAYSGEIGQRFRRSYASHSRGHNVILIDGCGQGPGPARVSQPLGAREASVSERFDFAVGSFGDLDKLAGSAEHRRALLYLRGLGWVVVDRIVTDRPRQIAALWHVAPDCTVAADGNELRTTDEGKGNLRLVPVGDVAWRLSLVKGQERPHPQGWYSRTYNQVEPATAAVYEAEIAATATFAWLIVTAAGDPPPASLRLTTVTPEAVTVEATVDGRTLTATIPLDPQQAEPAIADGE